MRPHAIALALALVAVTCVSGCSRATGSTRVMEITAYCPCRKCCEWHRGSWKFLKLDFWNRYTNYSGRKYTGRTASGTRPHPPRPGLVSVDTLVHPWMLPPRLVLPWLWLPQKGTIAADTDYYPFGTVMYVPGWGWGIVEDRGGAIKGPNRLDLFYRWHWQALRWGRQHVEVEIFQ